MRFHTRHLMGFVIAAAFVFALIRHPQALWAVIIPLIGGLFVVLPVLGTAELLASRDSPTPDIGWGSGCLVLFVAAIGIVLALACLLLVMDLAS
jgi:hypothetical protein